MAAVAGSRDARAPSGSIVRLPSTSVAQAPVDAAPVPASADDRDSYAVTALADVSDRSLHAVMARFTAGLSPAAMAHAYLDWATHLVYSPGKRLQLMDKAVRKAVRFGNYAWRWAMEGGKTQCCIEPLPQDRRFVGPDWQRWRTASCTRPSCSISNGGTTPQPA